MLNVDSPFERKMLGDVAQFINEKWIDDWWNSQNKIIIWAIFSRLRQLHQAESFAGELYPSKDWMSPILITKFDFSICKSHWSAVADKILL